MLGYTEKEILQMQINLEHAMNYAKDAGDGEIARACAEVINLLEGLMEEGHI